MLHQLVVIQLMVTSRLYLKYGFLFQIQLFKTCLVFRFPEFLIHASRLAKGYPSPMKKQSETRGALLAGHCQVHFYSGHHLKH